MPVASPKHLPAPSLSDVTFPLPPFCNVILALYHSKHQLMYHDHRGLAGGVGSPSQGGHPVRQLVDRRPHRGEVARGATQAPAWRKGSCRGKATLHAAPRTRKALPA